MNNTELLKELSKAKAEITRIRSYIKDLTCDGCEYGDNCPSDANHYVCRTCQLTRILGDK